jgi:predicted TIM-barrel fold metal-dependent hydrolase
MAALPWIDPEAAADELERAVTQLGAVGVMLNGHTKGYPEPTQAAWGWAFETGTHFWRLVLSGLFDACPGLTVILGTWASSCRSASGGSMTAAHASSG